MKIVFPDYIDVDELARQKFQQLGVKSYDDTPEDAATVIERIKDAEIVTANFIDLPREVIDTAPRLKFIIAPAVGYEWIDYKYAASKGIQVLNCPTQNAEAVAEHAVTLMLAVAHRITEADAGLGRGEWQQQQLMGIELSRKRLGLVGYGKIGKLIERKVSGLGMEVHYVNSQSSGQELDQLLSSSDVVCLCTALNESTKGIIDKRRLGLLKKNAILVNVGRGALVDEVGLLTVLQSGAIRGAGLDVFQNEPFTGGAPEKIVAFAKLSNVVATPHIGYNTEETKKRLGQELLANIESILKGQPMNVVSSPS